MQMQFTATGMLWKTGGGIAFDPDCCCGPCAANCAALADCYRIVDYGAPFVFAPCAECMDLAGPPSFAGLYTRNGTDCIWASAAGISIEGKHSGGGMLSLFVPTCTWYLDLFCTEAPSTPVLIWSGTKAVGNTPAGTYARTGGCDTTGTIAIEVCP